MEAARGVLALASDQRLGLDPQPHAPHAHESAPAALARARAEQQTLSKERIELEKEFSLQHLPAKEELLGLSRELRSYASAFAAALSPAYWKLKRRVREFLQPDQTFCRTALPQKLEQAAALLERIHTFDSHPDHSRVLGPLYRGMATDFERLEDLVSWSQELARATGSHQRAMALLPRLQELRSMNERLQAPVMECLTQLDRALAACRRQPAREQELAQLCHGCGATGTALNIVSVAATSWGVPGTRTLGELAAGLKAHSLAKELERQVAANRELAQLLETEFAGIDTDTARLVAQTEWFEAVSKRVSCQEQMLAWLAWGGEGGRIERLKEALLQARSFQRGIVDLAEAMARHGSFDMPAFLPSPPQNCTLSQLRDKSLACREYGYLLGKWADFRRLGREADDLGLQEFVDLVLERELTPEHAYALYQFGAYDAMARELLGTDPVLAGYTRTAIEGVIGRFVALDKTIQTAHTRRIAHRLSQRPVPTGQSGARVSSLTELALIKHEIEKQKRHLPLRQLVQRSGRALQSLKPCFMMSPLSVAQYLPPGSLNFDLVIMDEASQLKPEDAMGAVARGSRLIVVGDSRQLPPTSFFDRLDGVDDDDENLVASAESILDRCLQVYPRRRLRWHYRSEHESLIAFSNAMFYDDNPLLVFPSPQRSDLRYGVHSRYIDGASYHKGRNLKEAQAVALAIRDHYRNAPELSLGVATFNREQSELIEELLERLQKEDPLLDRQIRESQESQESFFIKNLENVQGDERDVIFISTTYGPDPSTGRVFQRFGPLAGEDGWRRLNVITTRAKKRLELFTSLRPGDVVPGEGSKRGVHALKAYLEYAASGILPDYGLSTGASPDSDFEIAVMKHLSDRGFQSVPQVGVAGFAIDIGVKHPDNGEDYLLGIECDGASYHSAKSVRDRDRLRQEVLERKGWTIHRIWSTDWFKNRDFELNRLLDRIKTALDADRSSRATRLTPDKAAAEPVKTEQAPALAAPAELSLLEELKVFNEAQIVPAFPDRSRGLLRDEILRYIVNCKPQSLAEFHQAVPIELRQNTDTRQLQYLEEIFSIVAGYC